MNGQTPYSWRAWTADVRAHGATPGQRATAFVLVLFADFSNGTTSAKPQTIADETGHSLGTVVNHLRWFRTHGLVVEETGADLTIYRLTRSTPDSAKRTSQCETHSPVHQPVRNALTSAPASAPASAFNARASSLPPGSPGSQTADAAPAPTREDRPTNGTDHDPPHTDPVPGGTADPWRPVVSAVVDAYVSALEERAGVLPRQPPPKDGRTVVDLVRAELAAADRDDPAKVTAAAVRVTRFFATGFPSDRNMPPLWRLASFETFRRQWDMALEAAAAPPPPPRRQTADETLDAALRNPSLREFVTVTPEERAAVNAERDAARAERRAERMVEVVTGLMHKRMAQGYIAAVQP